MINELSRRDFIRNSSLATTAVAAGIGMAMKNIAVAADAAAGAAPATQKIPVPMGKIGNLNITRLILGGNLLTRYQHVRDLGYVSKLVRSYNSDNKVRETIELAEASGINTLSVNITPAVCKTLNDHRKNGGKIQWILYSTTDIENTAKYKEDIQKMADDGAEAIYIWGCHGDKYAVNGKMEVLTKMIEDVKLRNIPCGMGAHDLRVVQEVEKAQLPVDFYIKTLHHHNYPTAPKKEAVKGITSEVPGHWCSNPEETVEFMKTVKKPWIAFKIMAAGAIPPKDAFQYAFNSGADFALAGMFDFDVVEDCQITCDTVAKVQGRVRPWA
jgi:hypothetical protein